MEWLYQVNEKDNVVGRISRDEAHSKGVMHRSAMVFLLDSNERVFLQQRSKTKKIFPNCLEASSTFHVEYGESYEGAAKREVKEELGLEVNVEFIGKFVHHDSPEHQVVGVMIARYKGGRIELDPSEGSKGDFYPINLADKLIKEKKVTPWLREGWKLLREYQTKT